MDGSPAKRTNASALVDSSDLARQTPGQGRASSTRPLSEAVQADLLPAQARSFTMCGVTFTVIATRDVEPAFHHWTRLAKRQGRGLHVHLVNAYTLSLLDDLPELRRALTHPAAINLVDGTPVMWMARWKGLLPDRYQAVRGPSLFKRFLFDGDGLPYRHFLLGGSPHTLANLCGRIENHDPTIDVVGAESPPFRPLNRRETRRQRQHIVQSRADLVWVGLGTPKQDVEAAAIAKDLPVVAVAIGAAFDFAAGTKREAPTYLQNSGFEWVFRLVSEPRRLWRRYLFGNLRFVRMVLADRPLPR